MKTSLIVLARHAIKTGNQQLAKRVYAASIKIDSGKVDRKRTQFLQGLKKLTGKNTGDLEDALVAAGRLAQKMNTDIHVYPSSQGNMSMIRMVWRISYKASDYLDPINNIGPDNTSMYSVAPDLVVSEYVIKRPVSQDYDDERTRKIKELNLPAPGELSAQDKKDIQELIQALEKINDLEVVKKIKEWIKAPEPGYRSIGREQVPAGVYWDTFDDMMTEYGYFIPRNKDKTMNGVRIIDKVWDKRSKTFGK